MTKELSITTIKKELMNAFLGDMRIINSFSTKDVKKVTDYIGKNIFNYLGEPSSQSTHVDTYINFDASELRGYNAYIVIRMHKDLIKPNEENRIDVLASAVKEIATELFPYMTSYSDVPQQCCDGYIERYICFTLREYDKAIYEGTEKPLF